MRTPNGLTTQLAQALASRPAAPGLLALVVLLVVTAFGWNVPEAAWFWPAVLITLVLSVALSAAVHEVRRGLDSRRHRQRTDAAHTLLNEHPGLSGSAKVSGGAEIDGDVRELANLVQRFGDKLEDLITEVQADSRRDQGLSRS